MKRFYCISLAFHGERFGKLGINSVEPWTLRQDQNRLPPRSEGIIVVIASRFVLTTKQSLVLDKNDTRSNFYWTNSIKM